MTETPAPTADLARFIVGGQASARSACDSDCVWTFDVVKRTAAFVTLRDVDTHDTYRVRIRESRGEEWALPFGTYSLAAVATPKAAA